MAGQCPHGDLEASRQMRIKKRLLISNGGDGH